jgi:hypothetical protein
MSSDWKNGIRLTSLIIPLLSILLYSCYPVVKSLVLLSEIEAGKNKELVPDVITTEIRNITGTTALSGGYITDEGTSTVLSRGVCWGSNPTPTTSGNKTKDSAGAGSFSSNLTGLSGATEYYVRAYATNSVGTGYGEAKFFTTLGQSPTSKVKAATNINTSIATLNGSVNPNYLSTVVSFEYGITTGYGNSATANESPIEGKTVTNVSANISGLTMGTIYHYRIRATNSLGTTISKDMTFITRVADTDGK